MTFKEESILSCHNGLLEFIYARLKIKFGYTLKVIYEISAAGANSRNDVVNKSNTTIQQLVFDSNSGLLLVPCKWHELIINSNIS